MSTNRVLERRESTWIVRLFAPPVFEDDEDKTRVAGLLNAILSSVLAATVVGTAIILVLEPGELLFNLIFGVILVALLLWLRSLVRRGYSQAVSALLSFALWASFTTLVYMGKGIRDHSVTGYFLVITVASLLLGRRGTIVFGLLSILTMVGILYAEISGALVVTFNASAGAVELGTVLTIFVLMALLLYLAMRRLNEALERAYSSNRELQTLYATLEQRVGERTHDLEERTRELEASQRVTFAASERTSPEELLGMVVDLVRDQFDLYHAQVYLVDDEQQAAVLHESTGYAGSQLLQRKHRIPLDQTALVTQAIHTGQPIIVDDTSTASNFMPNPLLPETRSELVIPLRIRERVFGVLDAQDRVPGRFTESTVTLFQTMADQIAFLFENSDLLARVTEQTEALTVFTTQLRIAADIAAQLGTVLDPEALLQQVVELMQSRFGLYHAHIYVLEGAEGAQRLVIRAGSGEVGRVLREEGHAIPLDRKKSLVARSARERGPVLVADTALESDFMPNPLLPQTRSELSVPLIAGGRLLGVLDMQDDQAGRFTEADVDTFTTLAGQIAVALQNAALFDQVEASAREAQVRFEVSHALAGAQTEEEVLDAILQQAGLYPKTQVVIFINEMEGEDLYIVARRVGSFGTELPSMVEAGVRFPASQFQMMEQAETSGLFVSDNVSLDEHTDPFACEMAKQMGTASMAIIPIRVGDEEIGSILVSSEEERYIDDRKLNLYQTLAEQGARALQSARLRAEVLRSGREYRTLNEGLRDGVAHTDMEGTVLTCNPAFEIMVGYSLEELKEIPFLSLTPEKWHDIETKILEEQVLTRGYSDLYEKEYVRKDGVIFPVELTVYLTRDESDNPSGFWAYVRDITERKRTEAERERFALQLRTASDIAGQVNAILDPDELLSTVIPLVKERFNLYYVHVYVLDEEAGELRLRAGYGEPGRIMLEQGLSIPMDREVSLVAQAARFRDIVVVNDVTQNPNFLPNPLLPDTKAEVAVPMVVGDQVIGVFDVQHDEVDYFTMADLDVLSTLAGQVATALQNASLFENQQRVEEALQQRVLALTQPVVGTGGLGFADLFDLEEIQSIQDSFSEATGVASVITDVDGTPITEPTNSCHLCEDIIMGTEEGLANCYKPDLAGALNRKGPNIQPCLMGHQQIAVVGIYLGDQHIANWLIGQPLDTKPGEAQVLASADQQTGATYMSPEQFEQVADALYVMAQQLSRLALQNVQQARDIVQRQDAERLARESEIRFRTVADFTYNWETWLGADGRYIYVSPACERITGHTVDEFIESPELFVKMVHPDDRAVVETHIQDHSSIADTAPVEYRIVTKDGQERWVSHTCQAVYDADGNWRGRRGSNRDITVTRQLNEISRRLNAIGDEEEMLQVVTRTAMKAGSVVANLMYIDLDDAGEPEWLEIVAEWRRGGEPAFPVGSRFRLADFPLSRLYIDNPDESVLIADVSTDERVDENSKGLLTRSGSRALAVIPLNQAGRWVGIIMFSWDSPHEFSEQEVEIYNALPALTAPAVANRRLLVERERALTEILYHISRGLSTTGDASELLQILAHPAMDADMSTANLFYVDSDQTGDLEWAEIVAQWHHGGEPPIPVGSRFYLPEFPLADLWVASPNETQFIADVIADERVNENARDLLTQSCTRALAIIPLTQAERWVGIITFGWDEPHEFSEQEVEVYRALTGLASPAVASRRLMDSLERMVSERTEQLSTASDIAGQVNAILDPDQLLYEVVTQLHERFGLYHVHVYLLSEPLHELLMQADPSEVGRIMGQRQLVMRAGSGEVGQALLEQRHAIPLNREQSLVARAARTRKMVSVADTGLEPGFMPNPLLPETRSEVSVPLVAGDRVLGVLDVQDNRPDRFTQSDLDVFSTLAGQISTALQNAGYVEQVEARLRVSQVLAGAQTEDEVLDAMGRVAGFYPQARVTIYTVDPEAEEYVIILRRDEAFESGISSIELDTRFTAVQYPLLKYVETNDIFISRNLPLDERIDPATRELAEQVGYTSAVFFPIVARGEQLGLVVATAKEEGFFDERRLRLYQSLAEQGAVALYAARLYEETQKVAERLHEVNQIKSEFMADMSHELRTPLNSIIGYAELMLMGISDADPDTLEDIQAIYDNGRHLLKIINDVLDLSKIEAGRMELNIEEVLVEPLLEELKTTNAGLLVNKPVEILVEVEEDLPPIEADRVRISQVVNNLVGNAIKFTQEGSITLRGYAKEKDRVCLEVQDTGVGLNEDDLQEIFERYRQVGDVGARAKGTGLGLSITRHLVQMHDGEVDVHSKLGEGSIFTVSLPVKHPGEQR